MQISSKKDLERLLCLVSSYASLANGFCFFKFHLFFFRLVKYSPLDPSVDKINITGFCLHRYYKRSNCLFTTRFNTRCQLMMQSAHCTCTTVWSAVTPSMNSREYCVYFIDNVGLTKTDTMPASTTYFRQILILFLS